MSLFEMMRKVAGNEFLWGYFIISTSKNIILLVALYQVSKNEITGKSFHQVLVSIYIK